MGTHSTASMRRERTLVRSAKRGSSIAEGVSTDVPVAMASAMTPVDTRARTPSASLDEKPCASQKGVRVVDGWIGDLEETLLGLCEIDDPLQSVLDERARLPLSPQLNDGRVEIPLPAEPFRSFQLVVGQVDGSSGTLATEAGQLDLRSRGPVAGTGPAPSWRGPQARGTGSGTGDSVRDSGTGLKEELITLLSAGSRRRLYVQAPRQGTRRDEPALGRAHLARSVQHRRQPESLPTIPLVTPGSTLPESSRGDADLPGTPVASTDIYRRHVDR